jgi:hypothetical protein
METSLRKKGNGRGVCHIPNMLYLRTITRHFGTAGLRLVDSPGPICVTAHDPGLTIQLHFHGLVESTAPKPNIGG